MENFSDVYYMGLLFQNDLKHIRVHAIGPQYDTIRNICDELIEKLEIELKDFSDFAYEESNPIDNPANIKSHIDVEPLTQETFNWTDFLEYLNGSLNDFISAIESLDKGFLNDDIRYWRLQLKHNEMRRLADVSENKSDDDEETPTFCSVPTEGISDDEETESDEDETKSDGLKPVEWPDILSGAGITKDRAALEKPDEEDDSDDEDEESDDEDEEDDSTRA